MNDTEVAAAIEMISEIEGKVLRLLLDFHTTIVRNGIDAQTAYRELLKIGEYGRRIAPDIEGAEE